MVEGGISNMFLAAVRVEVGITDFHGNTAGEFLLVAQLKSQFFNAMRQLLPQQRHIGGVLLKGVFAAYRLLLAVWLYRTGIDAVGFFQTTNRLPSTCCTIRAASGAACQFRYTHRAQAA